MSGTGNTSIRSYNFFAETTVAAGGYNNNEQEFVDVDSAITFLSNSVLVVNDSTTDDLEFRFTEDPGGGGPHGVAKPGEKIALDFKRSRRIFLDGATGEPYRIFAW